MKVILGLSITVSALIGVSCSDQRESQENSALNEGLGKRTSRSTGGEVRLDQRSQEGISGGSDVPCIESVPKFLL